MSILETSDEYFMKMALMEARKAFDEDEVPVGAVVICKGKIIAKGYNRTQRLNDVTAHAEMQAFTSAAENLGGKYLMDCTLYVTLEPCIMCAGAAYWAQLGRLVYGATDPKRGYNTVSSKILHPKTEILKGILAEESNKLLIDFFQKKRD